MKVKELMSAPVVSVAPETPLKEAAALLVDRRISGVPVADPELHVIGVVSETDSVVRERGAGRGRLDLLTWLWESEDDEVHEKLRARVAHEAMSHPAVTISAEAAVATAAAYVVDRGVDRLPVVDDQKRLVGIVTRADLVRAFARSDAELEQEIREEVVAPAFSAYSPGYVHVEIVDGDVALTGAVECVDVAERIVSRTSQVPGVLSVRSQLSWESGE